MVQKRKHPRARLKIEVSYKTADVFTSNSSINISKGGIFIKTPNPPPMGTQLDLEFKLPDSGKTIQAAGEIVWCQHTSTKSSLPAGMGIKFRQISPDDLREVSDYVKKILPAAGMDAF